MAPRAFHVYLLEGKARGANPQTVSGNLRFDAWQNFEVSESEILIRMNPDISYILNFERSRKEQVIESLREFCINTEEGDFNSALISDDCSISFIVDVEEPLNWYYESYEHSRRIKGKIIIGSIQLWIREKQNETIFEFWAPASSTGKACLASKNLHSEFIKLLENNNGFEVKLDHSNGYIETIFKPSIR